MALFDDIATARQVVEELVGADFERSSISLITNDAHNQYRHYLDKDYVPRDDAVTAGEGAGFGAVVGALTGVLAGLAALMISGDRNSYRRRTSCRRSHRGCGWGPDWRYRWHACEERCP